MQQLNAQCRRTIKYQLALANMVACHQVHQRRKKKLITYLKFSKACLEECLERLQHVHSAVRNSISDSSPPL